MENSTPSLGMNRTGMQMSPLDGSRMQSVSHPPAGTTGVPGDDTPLHQIRSMYVAQTDSLGSVPIPGTVTGTLTAAMSMLAGRSPQRLIDKLGERLAFERAGTRLYDALLDKLTSQADPGCSITEDAVRTIRAQEARHFTTVAQAIESIGGDPTSQTPCADLVGVESSGLIQVVTDPRTSLAQSLHALQTAEMTDNAGWELLIALADDHGQTDMIDDFTIALSDERQHLMQVRHWLNELTLGAAAAHALQAAGSSQVTATGAMQDVTPPPAVH